MISIRRQSLTCAFACSIALLLTAQQARSQGDDEATSRALFNEGRKLAEAGQYPAACPKFEAARRAHASTGVLMNLADCYEKTGRTASAWTTFGEAASVATRAGRQGDEIEATRRQTALEPRINHLTIHVIHEIPGLTLKSDGVEIPRGGWDVPTPVDPGAHEIAATAPDRQPWTKSFEVSGEAQTTTVEVPELRASAPAPVAQVSTAPQPVAAEAGPQSTPGNVQRWAGVAVGGAGIVALGTSVVIGLVAKTQYNAAAAEGGTARHTDSVSAANLGNVGTAVFVVGALATAAGVVIWLTAPSAPAQVGTNGRQLLLRGEF
jgi:hypothetical protein